MTELNEEDYTEKNWQNILDIVFEAEAAIKKSESKADVDLELSDAKEAIDGVESKWDFRSECGTFALFISVKETVLPRGDNFVVDVWLRNMSEEDVVISFGNSPTWPRTFWSFSSHLISWTPSWGFPIRCYFPRLTDREFLTLAGHEYFHQTWNNIGGRFVGDWWDDPPNQEEGWLPIGPHQLRFRAQFIMNEGSDNQQTIIIWSNTVEITVF